MRNQAKEAMAESEERLMLLCMCFSQASEHLQSALQICKSCAQLRDWVI